MWMFSVWAPQQIPLCSLSQPFSAILPNGSAALLPSSALNAYGMERLVTLRSSLAVCVVLLYSVGGFNPWTWRR